MASENRRTQGISLEEPMFVFAIPVVFAASTTLYFLTSFKRHHSKLRALIFTTFNLFAFSPIYAGYLLQSTKQIAANENKSNEVRFLGIRYGLLPRLIEKGDTEGLERV